MRRTWACLLLSMVPLLGQAQEAPAEPAPAMTPREVPAALQGWVGWAQASQAFRQCALRQDTSGQAEADFACLSSGPLVLKGTADGWSFRWSVARATAGWVPLPRLGLQMPQVVGHAVVVRDDEPQTWLPAGTTELIGTLKGQTAPLTVPEVVGPIQAQDASGIRLGVSREGDQIMLGETAAVEHAPLQVRVWRRLEDTVPRLLTTVVRLQGGTEGQVVDLGPALPDGFLAQATEGAITVGTDGHWRVAAGQGEATVVARCIATSCAQPQGLTVGPSAHPAPWPSTEVWSLQVAQGDRASAWHSAAGAVDPAANGVPPAWQGLPAVALQAGQTVDVAATAHPAPKGALTVAHHWVLDADRAHWLVEDQLGGTMGSPWRLVPAPGSTLGRVTAQGMDQVSNRAPGETDGGVPWGTSALALSAVRRQPRDAPLSAVGWQQDATEVSGTLTVPPDVRVLHISGPDRVTNTWLSSWDLFQVFLGALLVALVIRVLGWGAGAIAALYVALATPALGTGAPFYSLAALVALAACWGWLQGRWRRTACGVGLVIGAVFVLQGALFVRAQWQGLFHPKQPMPAAIALGNPFGDTRLGDDATVQQMSGAGEGDVVQGPSAPAEALAIAAPAAPVAPMPQAGRRQVKAIPAPPPLPEAQTVAPTPAGWASIRSYWSDGQTSRLFWDGPVQAQETFRVWWIGPLGVALWRALTLGCLGLLVLRLVRRWPREGQPVRAVRWPWVRAGVLALVLVPSLGWAQATPDPATLTELGQRLNAPPRCAPQCARWTEGTVMTEANGVRWTLQAEADQPATLPLPQPGSGVVLDGGQAGASTAIFTEAGQAVLVGAGTTTVTLHYRTQGPRWSWTLEAPGLPLTVQAGKAAVDGVRDGQLTGTTVALSPAQAQTLQISALRPYVRLDRRLELTDRWRLTTTAQLVGTANTPLSVSVPLLPGERAVTAADVNDHGVQVTLRASAPSQQWTSEVPAERRWSWTAPTDSEVVTTWTIVASPWWQVALEGQVAPVTGPAEGWMFTPFPGQGFTLQATPLAVRSNSMVAVDSAQLVTQPGQRSDLHTLTLEVRAHGAQAWPITLPVDATLLEVYQGLPNGAAPRTKMDLALDHGRLVLPLTAGTTHWTVMFRQGLGAAFHRQTPAVGWTAPTVNATVQPGMAHRWLLASRGPGLGPSVMLWSSLGLALVLAWGLGRLPHSPLGWVTWMALAAGMILADSMSWLIVAGLLLASEVKGRQTWGPSARIVWRVVLAVWAVIALWCLVSAVGNGLLSVPEAWTGTPVWQLPSSEGGLATVSVWSAPMWLYRLILLGWSLWLAWALVGWGRRLVKLWLQP